MKTQQELLKALDYLYKLPPSKWDLPMITRFKRFVLDDLIMFVTKSDVADEKGATMEEAEEIFNKTGAD